MWIQFNNSFLSIVLNRNNQKELLVRARVKGDIEKIFPSAKVFIDESADYKFRAFLPKSDVVEKIMGKVLEINYDNFKNSILNNDHERKKIYSNIWFELKKLQN